MPPDSEKISPEECDRTEKIEPLTFLGNCPTMDKYGTKVVAKEVSIDVCGAHSFALSVHHVGGNPVALQAER